MKLGIIGTGYVGLVTGTCFADLGNRVICIDKNTSRVEKLNTYQEIPFFEPELKERVIRNFKEKRLLFSTNFEEMMKNSDIVFIAVGTPSLSDGSADISAIWSAVQEIVSYQKSNILQKIIVVKSTVPVGTAEKIKAIFYQQGISEYTLILSNPEFLREGHAIYDFFHPDRIVLGSDHSEALDALSLLYEPLYRIDVPIVKTSHESAELSKYAANAFLATKISFINEIASLCDKIGADVGVIAKIMGMDRRIGKFFLHPGPGYGGSCFPKDTKALIKLAQNLNIDFKIVKAVEAVNQIQKKRPLETLYSAFPEGLAGKKIAILGLSFKPETDDIRESSAIELIRDLLELESEIAVHDPEAMDNARNIFFDRILYCEDAYATANQADAIVLLTEWHQFRELDLHLLKQNMKDSVFLDFRNLYKPDELRKSGFRYYYVIGKPG